MEKSRNFNFEEKYENCIFHDYREKIGLDLRLDWPVGRLEGAPGQRRAGEGCGASEEIQLTMF